jgi:DNA-binding transcriptional LysR family regulator
MASDALPPPPDTPPTPKERMWAAVERAANAIADNVESGRLQPLSPTYLTRAHVMDLIDGAIRQYDEAKHELEPEGEQALDRLVHTAGQIDALQSLRYQIFGSPLDLRDQG